MLKVLWNYVPSWDLSFFIWAGFTGSSGCGALGTCMGHLTFSAGHVVVRPPCAPRWVQCSMTCSKVGCLSASTFCTVDFAGSVGADLLMEAYCD